jgi:tetratricopeptide (TPR) repeat protein
MQFDDALQYYESAIELDPEYPMEHGGRSRLLASLGLFDEAIAGVPFVVSEPHIHPVLYLRLIPSRRRL